jgi:hypothetical protein
MSQTKQLATFALALLAGAALIAAPDLAHAQTYAQQVYTAGQGQVYAPAQTYGYQETYQVQGTPLLFGVAANKICQIKNFLFAGVYVLGAIAFVIFAVRALFTKFEMKQFIPIIGALFVVASADLFIYWISEDAYFCPTTLQQFSG